MSGLFSPSRNFLWVWLVKSARLCLSGRSWSLILPRTGAFTPFSTNYRHSWNRFFIWPLKRWENSKAFINLEKWFLLRCSHRNDKQFSWRFQNGIFSALPYFGMLLVSLSGSCFADLIRKKRFLSTTATRKLFNSIGMLNLRLCIFFGTFYCHIVSLHVLCLSIPAFLLPAACLVAAMFVGCNELWIKILLIMTVSLNGFNYAGFNCNHIDIASNYAGTLMGITNMVANLTGFLTPILINYIVGPTVSHLNLILWCLDLKTKWFEQFLCWKNCLSVSVCFFILRSVCDIFTEFAYFCHFRKIYCTGMSSSELLQCFMLLATPFSWSLGQERSSHWTITENKTIAMKQVDQKDTKVLNADRLIDVIHSVSDSTNDSLLGAAITWW